MAASKTCYSPPQSFKIITQPCPSLLDFKDVDDSFVILSRDPDSNTIKTIEKAAGCDTVKGTKENASKDQSDVARTSLKVTSSSDFKSEEVQAKVLQIIDENALLKETVVLNNKIMKLQYENILEFEEYRYRAEENKDFIEMLKKEKHNLTNELDELKVENDAHEREITAMKEILENTRQSSDNIVKESEKKIRELSDGNRNLANHLEELIREKDAQDEEFAVLEQNLIGERQLSSETVKALDLAKKDIDELKEENRNLTGKIEELKNEEIVKETEILALKQALMEQTDNNDAKTRELESLNAENGELKMELAQARSLSGETETSLNKEIDGLRSQLASANQRPSADDMAKVEEELKLAKVSLMQLEQGKVVADTQIDALNQENICLQAAMEDIQRQNTEMYAFKAQLEVFKSDYNALKLSKRRLKCENDTVSEERDNLRVCCQHLQEEINALLGFSASQQNAEYNVNASTSCATEESLKCPVCSGEFTSQEELQHHVERCLVVSRNAFL